MVVVLCGWGEGLADGVFVPRRGSVRLDIHGPEQKAVIVHRNGEETLILSVKYAGALTDFAWVVPVASRPKVEKGDPEIFRELAELTVESGPGAPGPPTAGLPGGDKTVQVLERRQVGVYDVAVLAAGDPNALTYWLRHNGYALPGNPAAVLQHYVRKRWLYVAMRIDPRRTDEQSPSKGRSSIKKSLAEGTLHPLSLSFASQTAVYPLRMTSLNPGKARILLYVLAETKAEAEGFATRWAAPLYVVPRDSVLSRVLRKAGFTEETPGTGGSPRPPSPTVCFLTKLEASLAPQQMKDDVVMTFTPSTSRQLGLPPLPAVRRQPEGRSRIPYEYIILGTVLCAVVLLLVLAFRRRR